MKNSQNRVKENGHILIIGGTGFVGKHLVRHFLEKSFTVFSLSRNQEIHGRVYLIQIEGNINN
jgi:nucleoside-diphosphate-sugar epimerase